MTDLFKDFEFKLGFWALFDQGTVSLGNFLTQMLLARGLSWNDYGVFALLYGILFFLVNTLGSLITYPLSVMGASADQRTLGRLAGTSLWFDAAILLPEGLVVFVALSALHRVDLLVPVTLALASWQSQETLRRALMAHLRHRESAWGDSLSYLGQGTVIAFLIRAHELRLGSIFYAIAATSAVAAVVQVFQIRPLSTRMAEVRALAAEYWRLGGWASSTNFVGGATQQAFPWVLGLLFGTAEAGSLQALVNPLKIFNPVLVGAQNLIVPAAAKAQRERGICSASRVGLAYAIVGSLLVVPYFAVLFIWPHGALGILYGSRSPYSHLELALRICVFAYALGYLGDAICALLNGLGRPKSGFFAQLTATCAALALGVPLTIRGGLVGAILGLGICALVKVGIALASVSSAASGTTGMSVASEPLAAVADARARKR